MAFRVGFDVGGTFTDFVLQAPSGELTTGKRLTTYPDPSTACLAGLDELMTRAGVPWTELVQAVHGTTLKYRNQGFAAPSRYPFTCLGKHGSLQK